MPITGNGFEIHIVRHSVQSAKIGAVTRTRTVGTYQVFRDGQPVTGLSGTTAEAKGPGDNSQAENGKRVEAGRYPLFTQDGSKYVTIGYKTTAAAETDSTLKPKPGIELKQTGARTEILIHPGVGFLSSIGCINLCTSLPNANERISFPGSRRRVIAVIDNLKAFLGNRFPSANGRRIENAFAVIDGEP